MFKTSVFYELVKIRLHQEIKNFGPNNLKGYIYCEL